MSLPTLSITSYQLRPSFNLKSIKFASSPRFPISNLVCTNGFVFKTGVFEKKKKKKLCLWPPFKMCEFTTTAAFRNVSGVQDVEGEDDDGSLVKHEHHSDEFSSEFFLNPSSFQLESTLNRLSKWIVSAIFLTVILLKHDGESLWLAMGSVINAILSVVLKRLFNQQRPFPTSESGPGMPSSHAQSIFFIFLFAILSTIEWLGANAISLTLTLLILAFGSYLSWLRVSQQLHSVSQVVVGAGFGSVFSIGWYLFWKAVMMNEFESSVLVRVIVFLGALGLSIGFVVHVIKYWFRNERSLQAYIHSFFR